MSPWLAIESATIHLSVALFKDGVCVEEIVASSDGRTHAEKLLPLILELLQKNNQSLNDLSGVTYSAGPGSFTSLRVGLATAVGICTPLNLKLRPVSTLKALALNFGGSGLVAPVLKAGRGRIYGAVFELSDSRITRTAVAEALYAVDDFKAALAGLKQIRLGGPGLELLDVPGLQKSEGVIPKASLVGNLAYLDSIPAVTISEAPIFYLQPPDLG